MRALTINLLTAAQRTMRGVVTHVRAMQAVGYQPSFAPSVSLCSLPLSPICGNQGWSKGTR